MPGLYSKRKGYSNEYKLKKVLEAILPSQKIERVPLSGMVRSSNQMFKSDLIIYYNNNEFFCETKIRKNTFNKLYDLTSTFNFVHLNENFVLSKIENIEKILTLNYCIDYVYEKELKMIKTYIKENDILIIRQNWEDYLVIQNIIKLNEKVKK